MLSLTLRGLFFWRIQPQCVPLISGEGRVNYKPEKIMNNVLKIIIVAGFVLTMATGCTTPVKKTGFLSDYSRLEPTKGSLRYIDMARLSTYSKFIIEPVIVNLDWKRREFRPDRTTLKSFANYMHNAIVNAIGDRYMIVSQPGPGVAQMRIALTDIETSSPVFNVLPHTRLSGEGLGGASMEAELLDSQTGEQIGALIEGQKGSRFSFASLEKWGDAKAVMDDWAKRFRERLDEAHGY